MLPACGDIVLIFKMPWQENVIIVVRNPFDLDDDHNSSCG